MNAVILHDSGRIDAAELEQMTNSARMMFNAGMTPPRYAILELCKTLDEAIHKAADLRRQRRAKIVAAEERAHG